MTLTEGPLTGVRALDLIDGLGAYGPKLFVGLGADVVRVEPPGGSSQRRASPRYDAAEKDDPCSSLEFLHYNAGKQGITLNLETQAGRGLLRGLLDYADVVFDNGHLARAGFDIAALAETAPPLVVVSVTPFGLTGERSAWLGDDLVCQAMSGMIGYYGFRDERPARFGPHQASEMSGLAAALGALIALFDSRHSGKGEVIDIAAERVGALVTLQMSNASLYHQFGFTRPRHQRADAPPDGLYMARDGYIQMGALRSRAQVLELLDLFGAAEDLHEIAVEASEAEFARHPHVREVIRRFVADRTRVEVVEAVQARGVICVPLNNVADLVADPFLQGRGFFGEVALTEESATFLDAGVPIRFQSSPFQIGGRPPVLGEHNQQVYARIGVDEDRLRRLKSEGVV